MLLDEAKSFIQTMFNELNYSSSETQQRLNEIEEEIKETGSYTHTYEELVYGSKWHGEILIVVLGDYFGNL